MIMRRLKGVEAVAEAENRRRPTIAEIAEMRAAAKRNGPRPMPAHLEAKLLEEMDEDDLLTFSMSSRTDFEEEEAAPDEEGQ